MDCGFANYILETGRFIFEMKDNKDVDSLSHTTWRCQYHVVFAPKYRRMVIYGQIKKDIGQILRQEYIKNQLQQDQIADQLSLKEFVDP